MDREKDIELSVSEISLDKAELIARGKVHGNGKTGRFFYSLYDGKVSVISESGDISKNTAFVRYWRRCFLLQEKSLLRGFWRKRRLLFQ